MEQPSVSGYEREGQSDWRPLWGCTGGQLDSGWRKDVVAGATDKRDASVHRPSELGWVHIHVPNYYPLRCNCRITRCRRVDENLQNNDILWALSVLLNHTNRTLRFTRFICSRFHVKRTYSGLIETVNTTIKWISRKTDCSIIGEDFLGYMTTSFSRRVLLHGVILLVKFEKLNA